MRDKGNFVHRVTRLAITMAWLAGMIPAPIGAQQRSTSGAAQGVAPVTRAASSAATTQTIPNKNAHGIKVHGHWTIEVRNPDGTLATHREFENSLSTPNGLAAILARTNSVGVYSVALGSATEPCILLSNSSSFPCRINEVTGAIGFSGLNVSAQANGALVLSGTMTSGNANGMSVGNGTITDVSTSMDVCPASTPPSPPCQGSTMNFTNAILSPAITVSSGQTIAVTVTITFS